MVAKICLAALSLVLLSACAAARSGELRIPNYDHLSRKATDKTSVSLSGPLLRLALKLSDADDKDPDRQLLAQVKRVQVRSYEFAADHAYTQGDVDIVRKQLQTPQWSQIVKVRNAKENEQVDVFICIENGETHGLAIISAEPRELTIVNIVGSISIEQLARLRRVTAGG
jgi:hypothetical protein